MIPLSLLAVHTIGDFVLQTNWMATNKSKNSDALFAHTLVYSLCFLHWGLVFVIITLITHTITDAVTSRITAYLYANLNDQHFYQPNSHWFFVVIGFDQLIHFATLAYAFEITREIAIQVF